MQIVFMFLLALHALSGVFWAGTTFTLVRSGGQGMAALRRPQTGASLIAIASGIGLWAIAHRRAFGSFERGLAVGAIAAVLAGVLQFVGHRQAQRAEAPGSGVRIAPLGAQRAAAGLLAVAVAAMVCARYIS
ncbi:MAG: hypothetical protein EOP39_00275 [Rubrivivax sp.]|nr:MAG: hypothetical protein EOP39_00275 [Rubrivivax sp.]